VRGASKLGMVEWQNWSAKGLKLKDPNVKNQLSGGFFLFLTLLGDRPTSCFEQPLEQEPRNIMQHHGIAAVPG
jgi:hypothetical protein